MLNINSGLSISEASTCSTMVPRVVLSFREIEYNCCPNMGPLSLTFVMVTNTSALADLTGVPVYDTSIVVSRDTSDQLVLFGK